MVAKINICSHTVRGCGHSDAVQVVRANTVQQSQEAVCLGLGVACCDYLPAVSDPTVCGDGGDLTEHGGLVVVVCGDSERYSASNQMIRSRKR